MSSPETAFVRTTRPTDAQHPANRGYSRVWGMPTRRRRDGITASPPAPAASFRESARGGRPRTTVRCRLPVREPRSIVMPRAFSSFRRRVDARQRARARSVIDMAGRAETRCQCAALAPAPAPPSGSLAASAAAVRRLNRGFALLCRGPRQSRQDARCRESRWAGRSATLHVTQSPACLVAEAWSLFGVLAAQRGYLRDTGISRPPCSRCTASEVFRETRRTARRRDSGYAVELVANLVGLSRTFRHCSSSRSIVGPPLALGGGMTRDLRRILLVSSRARRSCRPMLPRGDGRRSDTADGRREVRVAQAASPKCRGSQRISQPSHRLGIRNATGFLGLA